MGEARPDDAMAAYVELLEGARADPAVVGVVVFGSRAVDAYITSTSDVDCFVILAGTAEAPARWQRPHGSVVEVWPLTLDAFRTHAEAGTETAWNRPSLIQARVDLDKLDGEIAAVVDAKRRLRPDEVGALVDTALDTAINSLYRALKSAENGFELASRLDGVEAISPLLTTAFALEGRVRPWNKWLERELEREPLMTSDFAPLLELVRGLATNPSPARLREAFGVLERPARIAGHGAIVDGWEPDVAWLRGEAPYRAPRT